MMQKALCIGKCAPRSLSALPPWAFNHEDAQAFHILRTLENGHVLSNWVGGFSNWLI